MIEQEGIVVSLSGNLAEVRMERDSGCAGCGAQSGCGTSLVDRFLGRRVVTLKARNQAEAKVGERVAVGVSESGLLASAFAAYLVPILGLAAGAVLGQWLVLRDSARAASDIGADLPALAGGVLGFALALFWLRRYSARWGRDPEHDPVVLRRVSVDVACEPLSRSGR
ncbi:MAG: SoxR reducing system RseC family protein [Bdellovibrio bacteriovorus]